MGFRKTEAMVGTATEAQQVTTERGRNNNDNERSWGRKVFVPLGALAVAGGLIFGGTVTGDMTPQARADKCYIVGGMGDPNGDWARGVFDAQGRTASCNEGVEHIPYSASIWPLGPDRMVDSVAPGVADLTNRLNNSPDGQHKRVLSFSEGTEVAAQAGNQTHGTNIKVELYGGPQGRTGAFNSPIVTDVPLVAPIIDMVGIPRNTPLLDRPGVEYERVYREDDGYANLGAQGHDVISAIPGAIGIADGMINRQGHQIPDPNSPRHMFIDGDGVANWVHDDGDPRTVSGAGDPRFTAPGAPVVVPPHNGVAGPNFVAAPGSAQSPIVPGTQAVSHDWIRKHPEQYPERAAELAAEDAKRDTVRTSSSSRTSVEDNSREGGSTSLRFTPPVKAPQANKLNRN